MNKSYRSLKSFNSHRNSRIKAPTQVENEIESPEFKKKTNTDQQCVLAFGEGKGKKGRPNK